MYKCLHNHVAHYMNLSMKVKFFTFQASIDTNLEQENQTLFPGSSGLVPKLLLIEATILLLNILSDPSDLLSVSSLLAFRSSRCDVSLQYFLSLHNSDNDMKHCSYAGYRISTHNWKVQNLDLDFGVAHWIRSCR